MHVTFILMYSSTVIRFFLFWLVTVEEYCATPVLKYSFTCFEYYNIFSKIHTRLGDSCLYAR